MSDKIKQDKDIVTANDIKNSLYNTMYDLKDGKIDIKSAKTILYLSREIIKVIELQKSICINIGEYPGRISSNLIDFATESYQLDK